MFPTFGIQVVAPPSNPDRSAARSMSSTTAPSLPRADHPPRPAAVGAEREHLELDHELGDAYWQRGLLLQKQGATQDALRDLQTALEKRPSRFEAYASIALCDQDLQRWPEAERAWRLAIAGDTTSICFCSACLIARKVA